MTYRCSYVKDAECPDDGKFFLPRCMGGAVYGISQCTCRPRIQRKELENEMMDLRRRIVELEKARSR